VPVGADATSPSVRLWPACLSYRRPARVASTQFCDFIPKHSVTEAVGHEYWDLGHGRLGYQNVYSVIEDPGLRAR
jgi:hypothetical protein